MILLARLEPERLVQSGLLALLEDLRARNVHVIELPRVGHHRQSKVRHAARLANTGVDHIDTAQFYGPDVSNELIREAL
jgi:aryl-alcohol dehydrogenase-like predicted oxidoreductase